MFSAGRFLHALLDTIIPPLCHICREFIPEAQELLICPSCQDKLPRVAKPYCSICGIPFDGGGDNHPCGKCLLHPPHFDVARAPFLYEGTVRDLIHALKYEHRTHLRTVLALLALDGIDDLISCHSPQIVVPVPLHRSRLKQRGFNQAVLIGDRISRRLSLPMSVDALARVRPTAPQIELSADERRGNVKGAFSIARPELIIGKRVLLLDDVMTTGSTVDECAGILKKGGATAVIAVTVARTAR